MLELVSQDDLVDFAASQEVEERMCRKDKMSGACLSLSVRTIWWTSPPARRGRRGCAGRTRGQECRGNSRVGLALLSWKVCRRLSATWQGASTWKRWEDQGRIPRTSSFTMASGRGRRGRRERMREMEKGRGCRRGREQRSTKRLVTFPYLPSTRLKSTMRQRPTSRE